MIMDEDGLTEEFIRALLDRFTAPELVDLVDIPMRELIDAFEDYIVDYYEDLCEEMQWSNEDESEDG